MEQKTFSTTEHRKDKRFDEQCLVYVRGISENNKRIKTNTVTDNIGQGGLYFQSPYAFIAGSYIFAFVRLLSGAALAAKGKVVRIKKERHGLNGLAVYFEQSRFIQGTD